jgi:hypothetical protein
MSYKQFEEAYAFNKRAKEHLINLGKTRVGKQPEFALLLGAGASISSNIKTGADMIQDWRKKAYASYKGKECFKVWLKQQDWFDSEDEYSRLFEKIYDQPSQRRSYIENAINKANPSWGYAYLTALLDMNFFNVVFTTNFDDLINEGCYNFSNELRPMVCAHDSAVSSVRVMSERPKVIKLHGDFLYDNIKNTSSELQSLEVNMRDKFKEFAKEFGLVVVGYSGQDQSIMDLLDVLVRSDSYFRNGIYWCIQPPFIPQKRLRQLLRNDRVFWVEIEGYDELMAEIADATRTPLPDGITAPHNVALKNTIHLIEKDLKVNNPIIQTAYSDLKEIYSKVEKALNDIGLSDWSLHRDESRDNFLSNFRDVTLPFIECLNHISRENDAAAIECLKIFLENKKSIHAKSAWYHLIKLLLKDTEQHSLVRELLFDVPPDNWQDSTHYLQRSYFCLYLNQVDEALSFAGRALEFNQNLTAAKINIAIAYLISDNKQELRHSLSDIKLSAVAEHHNAALSALSGDFYSTMSYLHKAFVLGKYSPIDACRNVAFRTLWHIKKFEEHLMPFMGEDKIDFPYKNSCPMSEGEQNHLKKINMSILKKQA